MKYIRIYCNDVKIRSTGKEKWYRDQILIQLNIIKGYDGNYDDCLFMHPNEVRDFSEPAIIKNPNCFNNIRVDLVNISRRSKKKVVINSFVSPISAMYDSNEERICIKFNNPNMNKNILSPRNIPFVSNMQNIITCENWNKRYDLFIIDSDNNVKSVYENYPLVNVDILNHTYVPYSLLKFCKDNNLKIGKSCYEMLILEFNEEFKDYCRTRADKNIFEENKKYLPTKEIYDEVVVEDYGYFNQYKRPENFKIYL